MIINTRPIDLGRKLNVLLQKYKCSFTHIPLTKVVKIQPSEKAKHYISHSSNMIFLYLPANLQFYMVLNIPKKYY